jgi:S-adenosylmethionine hydrolase
MKVDVEVQVLDIQHSIKVQNKKKIQEQFAVRGAVLVWPEIHVNNI